MLTKDDNYIFTNPIIKCGNNIDNVLIISLWILLTIHVKTNSNYDNNTGFYVMAQWT